MNECLTETVVIDPEHPALPGHFPGQPVVPGVVILERVRAGLKEVHPQLIACGVKKLKLLRLLKPKESFYVRFADVKNGGIRFKCLMSDDDSILAEGHLSLLEMGNV